MAFRSFLLRGSPSLERSIGALWKEAKRAEWVIGIISVLLYEGTPDSSPVQGGKPNQH